MRIFHENTENYIRSLAVSISKDPASLENWRCVHLQPCKGEKIAPSAADKIKESSSNVDCDIVFCGDGDILMVSRELSSPHLQNLADLLMLGGGGAEVDVYDLFSDWRTIRSILLSKTPSIRLVSGEEMKGAEFPEAVSFQEVFTEAKKLRTARCPQYVMVVDDDPLTRRLVAGAFKDKYALITAANAQEAVANYLLYAPDIVFLDINMPGISGLEVLRQLIDSDPDAYIVMFSGNSYLDNITAALSKGASGFVAKPFNKDKLRHYIEDSALHHCKYV